MNIEDIKKEVLNRIKETYRTIPAEKIIKWIDDVPAYHFEPRILDEDIEEIDVDKICNREISKIIDFLSQYKEDYILEERWPDYEDNIFVIVKRRSETLDEMAKRICNIVGGDCSLYLAKEEQIANIDKAIRKLEDKKSKIREL